ncbi:MAG: DUF305 domain-containing protein [Leptolyngbyaceae cyanobacterium SM1_1_3]|nr:DUF305 domain-containing protein [Leptolyngbyaceae cyanobacterium SM1_1_3]NJN01014.1 DUF305 domain-containing protein [Leptolyngbyaceae cyanobacterium RM1_1_2]NJO10202.1 DUF305 domain-containing protein [Leptolyngbyaceae cyanobacterium SL_1_1]
MRLKQTWSSLLLLFSILSVPAALTGCTKSSQVSESQAVPVAETPAASHEILMNLGPKDAEFDLRFIDGMILHHQGAIAMAEAVQQNSQRDQMQQLATAIIIAQQDEIAQMQQWRRDWYPNAGSELVMYDAGMGHTMAMNPEMQAAMRMDGNLGEADSEFDLRFIEAMVPHHEGALVMAEQALQSSDRPEIRQIAQNILATQQDEIAQMTQWEKDWYGQ